MPASEVTGASPGFNVRGLLADDRPGKRRLPCPECAKGRADDALELTVTPRRWAFWRCFRCSWEGREPLDDAAPPERRPARPSPRAVEPPVSPPGGLSPWARELLGSCRPITAGSPAEVYFHARGCALPEHDVLWHPALRHPSGHVGPALVAVVTDALSPDPINLHRTWLAADGSSKADLDTPRLLLKGHRKRGGVVRLFPDEELTTGLCIAEGVETAFSAAKGFRPAWATIDAGNLAAFPVLPGVESLTVAVDHDRAGLAAFNAVAARWLAAGREVRQWLPPRHGADLNDWTTGVAA